VRPFSHLEGVDTLWSEEHEMNSSWASTVSSRSTPSRANEEGTLCDNLDLVLPIPTGGLLSQSARNLVHSRVGRWWSRGEEEGRQEARLCAVGDRRTPP
jgi:hypothetical protein